MINRKQAAELLGRAYTTKYNHALLEAVYGAADGPTQEVLNAHPDLRQKRHLAEESRLAALQVEQDYKAALARLRLALDTDLRDQQSSNDQCDVQREDSTSQS